MSLHDDHRIVWLELVACIRNARAVEFDEMLAKCILMKCIPIPKVLFIKLENATSKLDQNLHTCAVNQ